MGVFIALLVLIAVAVVVVGFYLGWFKFSSRRVDSGSNVTLSMNKDKIVADKDKLLHQMKSSPRSDSE
jgi:hypothetical protein